jgi:hypothetical protein
MTDKEILEDWFRLMDKKVPTDPVLVDVLCEMIAKCRKDEPRINCGGHLLDYINICDEDDDMDSFYGSDYPW